MNQEAYPSDSDGSDEDFRPGEEQDSGSESESEEEPTTEGRDETKGIKRRRQGDKRGRKKTKSSGKPIEQSDDKKDGELDEEEEKRRTDALWASFLGGESNEGASTASSKSSASNSTTKKELKKPTTKLSPLPGSASVEKDKPTVAQIFEFAGEQIVLTKQGASKEEITGGEQTNPALSSASNTSSSTALPRRVGGGGGGLGAVLNQINKKNKLTTLEKTKLDWTSFKRQEGIEEDLHTHNKGKDGFLERRDFLDRTDLRQFEIEKSFRQTKRSNR